MRFLYYPEYINVGEAMILREDRIRAMGTVKSIIPISIANESISS
jgi:GTPase